MRPLNKISLIGLILGAALQAAVGFEPIKYNHPGLTVDLGVGLWAWPLPMDWDRDGDLDLVVSCPDVPYRGLYFFENPGGSKMPVFKAGKMIGKGQKNISVSYVDQKPRILLPGHEMIDFKRLAKIYPKTNLHKNRVRANQWTYVDYNGDGAMDLVVGVGDWVGYGWDNAYNAKGEWTREPLHGYVYVILNSGTNEKPKYGSPEKVQAAGRPVDVFGMPSPNFADFDGDGDLDLLCGEFLDGFNYFENTGTRTQPVYAGVRRLPITMDLQMIVVSAIDWDGDGDVDLVVGDEDGRVAFVEHAGKMNEGVPHFLAPQYFRQEADEVKFGALVTPVGVDWDGDGDEDLICGNTAGYVGFIENLDGGNPPKFAEPVRLKAGGKTLRIEAGPTGSIQGPAETKWGYTTLSVADWDHDGRLDLVVNSIWGKVVWYRNEGPAGLSPAKPVEVAWSGKPPKPKWNWWDPEPGELATQWRTTPVVIDLDQDGLNDLVMLDHEGYLAFYARRKIKGKLGLLPGQRIFTDPKGRALRLNDREAGKSGRRKLCFTDWDGDGKVDFLLNSANVEFWKNVSSKKHPWAFENQGNLHAKKLAGHTTSPTTVNWAGDGVRDLLLGAEDGRLYFLKYKPEERTEISGDGLVVKGKGFEEGVMEDKARAYSNRQYVWENVPEQFRGWRYTRTAGGEAAKITVSVMRDQTIYVASGLPALDGWEKRDGLEFVYTDKGRTRMKIHVRNMKAGEQAEVPQGTWTGGLVLIPPQEKKPNVLFIAVDDLRVELGCYGDTIVKSPNIDKLARRGTLFNRTYCQQAVCNPSRASLMTGLRLDTLGIYDLPTHFRQKKPDAVTLPQLFKQHGYFAQNIGKIFHNWRQDDYKGDPASWSVPAAMHYNSHGADKAMVKGKLPPNLSNVPRTEMRDVPDEAYFDGRIAAKAIAALGELKDRPFFLAVGFWKPHAHFNAPKKYWDLYDRAKIPLPENPEPPENVPKMALHDAREILRGFKNRKPTREQTLALRHGYYAATSYVDAQVGKVVDELDRLGLEKNTIIVFWSDHGFHLGEHGLWAKTSNFELDARVPMIIVTPDHKPGQRTEALTELLDLYPTLADLCGLSAPKNLEGKSLRPVLDDPTAKVKDAAFTQHPRPAYPAAGKKPEAMGYSMRTDRYRYTEWRAFSDGKVMARELYDHQKDPHETRNIVEHLDLIKTVEALSRTHEKAISRKGWGE